MAINFPTSPTTNDIWTENDLSWKFNGTSWIALPTPSVAGNVAYTPAGTGAVTTDVETKLRESVSVKDFGAVGDGVADDTTKIQAAIDYAALNKTGVTLGAGNYKITSALIITSSNVRFTGVGKASQIITSSLTDDVFRLGDGTAEVTNLYFGFFSIDASVTKTGGYAFNARKSARCTWDHVLVAAQEDTGLGKRLYKGFYFNLFDTARVLACNVTVSSVGVECHGDSDQSFGAGLFIDNATRIKSCGSHGVHIGGASAVHFGDCDIANNTGNGVLINDLLQSGVRNREVFFGSDSAVDANGQMGIRMESNSLHHLDINGTWIASNGQVNSYGAGISITPSQFEHFHMNLTGARIYNHFGSGVVINDGSFNINGGVILNNGRAVNGGHAIEIANSGVSDFVIDGVVFKDNGNATVGYGVDIVGGVDNYVIQNNVFKNNGQGSINNVPSMSQTRVVKDNIGYITSASGNPTLAFDVNGEAVVSHGMDVTPNTVNASVIGDNAYDVAIKAVTTTDITFRLRNTTTNADVNTSASIYWSAFRQ